MSKIILNSVVINELFNTTDEFEISRRFEDDDERGVTFQYIIDGNEIDVYISFNDRKQKYELSFGVHFDEDVIDYDILTNIGFKNLSKLFFTMKRDVMNYFNEIKLNPIVFIFTNSQGKDNKNNFTSGAEQRLKLYKYFIKKMFPSATIERLSGYYIVTIA